MSILVVEYIDTLILFNVSTARSACSGISFCWGRVEVLSPAGRHAAPMGGVRPKIGNCNNFLPNFRNVNASNRRILRTTFTKFSRIRLFHTSTVLL